MAVTSGFFNSINDDRLYNAEQMSGLFEGIISDGVFQNVDAAFSVYLVPNTRDVRVAPGRAWIKGHWIDNDSRFTLTIPNAPASPNQSRIDAIVLKIDLSTAVRSGSIAMIQGIASASPSKPTITQTTTVGMLPIGYVTSVGGTSTLSADNIEYVVGTDECPFIAAPLLNISIEDYLALWRTKFETWMDDLVDLLDGNQAAQLGARILNLENRVTPINLGGTGGETKTAAKENLGIKYGTESPSSISSQLETGDIYIHIVD